MSLDPAYQPLHQQAKNIEFTIQNTLDDHNHPAARELRQEAREFVYDLESHKSPRNLEHRLRHMQQLLDQARHNYNSYMSIHDAEHIWRELEEMCQTIRKFNDY